MKTLCNLLLLLLGSSLGITAQSVKHYYPTVIDTQDFSATYDESRSLQIEEQVSEASWLNSYLEQSGTKIFWRPAYDNIYTHQDTLKARQLLQQRFGEHYPDTVAYYLRLQQAAQERYHQQNRSRSIWKYEPECGWYCGIMTDSLTVSSEYKAPEGTL